MNLLKKIKKIHFVGIGGIGMSGIAELLINLGYKVSGCDLKRSSITERLESLGAEIEYLHSKNHIDGVDVVVYSSAVSDKNPELIEARKRAIPVIPRAEMLAELMRFKYGIAVSGAHGKTTTTCMIASILNAAEMDPTVIIGGRVKIWNGSNARLGQGDILVAEADESDGTFLKLSSVISVVTNIDYEHMDYYKSMEKLRSSFVEFVNKLPFYGLAVLCLDDREIRKNVIPYIKRRYVTYGLETDAVIKGRFLKRDNFGTRFELLYKGKSLGEVFVGMPGVHNVLNALAAIGVAMELGVSMDSIVKGLRNIGGLERRFQIKGETKGILIMDDYAHHPTEIKATLKTVRQWWPYRRLIVAFQPHRYSRTKALFDKFATSFDYADILIVNPIYPASEPPIEGVDSEKLALAIKEHGHKNVIYSKGLDETLAILMEIAKPGDMILTLGAGNIYTVGEKFLKRKNEKASS
ncbi:MAG: UDP-N-acetylmuramate--L-alanine ligase [Deltaproteobacteria bacterium]|nr:MAG: UDP-N-acetylmuramate--L-alanine ligase [Deltaproteobacteria bacterium]